MVSVVMPVFNKSALTRRCLNSVLDHSSRDVDGVKEIFVIDNGSSDDTNVVLETFREPFLNRGIRFNVITIPDNVGFGRAVNRGIRATQGEYLAILNNDTWVMPNWDQALRLALIKEKVSIIGPYFDEKPIAPSQSDSFEERAKKFLAVNEGKFRAHFVPILVFLSRTTLDALKFDHGGLFDERFFVTYEDTDLKQRMKMKNLNFGQTGSSYIWHQSMGTRSDTSFHPEGYEAEGLRLFIEKWGFDPRPADHTFTEKLKRRFRKWKEARGLF